MSTIKIETTWTRKGEELNRFITIFQNSPFSHLTTYTAYITHIGATSKEHSSSQQRGI